MGAPRRRGWAFSPWGFVRRVYVGASEDRIFFLGSALTFDALLTALPFIMLLLASLGYVLHAGEDAMADVLSLLDQALPSGAASERLLTVEVLIADVVASRAQLSAWGIPLFLVLATRLFGSARIALNEVFDTDESRPFLVGKALDLALVVISLALIVVNALLTVLLGGAPWIGRFAASLSTFAIGVVLFLVIYTVLPSRRVRWDTALVAAAVASLGFEIAKKLFGWYVAQFATVDRLVSNANVLAILLLVLWMYYTACIFLLGGEVAETYDLMRRQRDQRAVLG